MRQAFLTTVPSLTPTDNMPYYHTCCKWHTMHIYYSSTWEVQARGAGTQGYFLLHIKFKAGYLRPCLRNQPNRASKMTQGVRALAAKTNKVQLLISRQRERTNSHKLSALCVQATTCTYPTNEYTHKVNNVNKSDPFFFLLSHHPNINSLQKVCQSLRTQTSQVCNHFNPICGYKVCGKEN